MRREVELLGFEVATSDEREHRARLRVDRRQRGIRISRLIEHPLDRLLRSTLQIEVDRRLDPQARLEDLRCAFCDRVSEAWILEDLSLDRFDDVRRLRRLQPVRHRRQGRRRSTGELVVGEQSFITHARERVATTSQRVLG